MGGRMPSAKRAVKYFAMQSCFQTFAGHIPQSKNFNARGNLPLKPD
jgi:hypothetical protein